MVFTTKLSKGFQTVVPAEIRKKFDVSAEDILEWQETDSGKIIVSFRKKTNFKDAMGFFKTGYPTDAVKLKKKIAKGEKLRNTDLAKE